MDMLEIIMYIIGFLIIIGFIGYLAYDYLDYKKRLGKNLNVSNEDLNYNFDVSTSNLINTKMILDEHNVKIHTNTSNINDLETKVNNNNTLLSNTSNQMNGVFNTFHNNLNKYFKFKDGDNDISSVNQTNNKIFDYIFGANINQNLDLITKTTAYSGMTIMSDMSNGNNLTVCNSNLPEKCVRMATDIDGNFNIIPAGANNISFQNIKGDVFAQFNMQNNDIYLGGSNADTSPLYVKDNDVYVKNLRLISGHDNKYNRLYNYEDILNTPIYTVCELKNTTEEIQNSGTNTTVYNTTIDIKIKFNANYYIQDYKLFYIDLAQYVNIGKLATLKFISSGNSLEPKSYIINIKSENQKNNINDYNPKTYGHLTFRFIEDYNEIKEGTELNIIFQVNRSEQNITTLPDPDPSNEVNFKFITNTYLIKTS